MALGGGTFLVQNKVLPGAYINFVSINNASATLSKRGIAALGIEADWGPSGEVFAVTSGEFQREAQKIFGYPYTHDKLKGLREIFANIHTLYAYRLNGDGKKAENEYATAKYSGLRGNDLSISIGSSVDEGSFDVKTLLDNKLVDKQKVKEVKDLKANGFVDFKDSFELAPMANKALNGGSNGEVTGDSHQGFLDKLEKYSFNALGCVATDDVTKGLYINYTKRLRDDMGKKFQTVVYNKAADYEGVVNVKNKALGNEAGLVYWVTGIVAGTPVNKSALNKKYDGEFEVDVNYKQAELEKAIQTGEFTLHQVGDDIRVLNDINSLVTTNDTKGDVFKDNQTIRVIDQIANDIAVLFNTKYLGVVPNDKAGRVSLWADIVKHHEELEAIRAIEDFNDEDVKVYQGDSKKSVVVSDLVNVINAMEKLYMTVTIA